jgi:hypothetical protein
LALGVQQVGAVRFFAILVVFVFFAISAIGFIKAFQLIPQ